MTTPVLQVSTNGSALSVSTNNPLGGNPINDWWLGYGALGSYIEFFGLYQPAVVPNLITGSSSPPPSGATAAIYADFLNGVYYLNGVVSTLDAIFTANTVATYVSPPNFIVDSSGLLIENYPSMPTDTGSSAMLTPAALAAAEGLISGFQAIVGIAKFTISDADSTLAPYITEMDATAASFVLEYIGNDYPPNPLATIEVNGGSPALPQPATSIPGTLTQAAWMQIFPGYTPPSTARRPVSVRWL